MAGGSAAGILPQSKLARSSRRASHLGDDILSEIQAALQGFESVGYSPKNAQSPGRRSIAFSTSSSKSIEKSLDRRGRPEPPKAQITGSSTNRRSSGGTQRDHRRERSSRLSETNTSSVKARSASKHVEPDSSVLLADMSFRRQPLPAHRLNGKSENRAQVLEKASEMLQEKALTEDLLSVLMGTEGEHLKSFVHSFDTSRQDAEEAHLDATDTDEQTFGRHSIEEIRLNARGVDPSLQALIAKISPLAVQHNRIRRFIVDYSQYGRGFVCHALCSGINDMLRTYLLDIAQYEHQCRTNPNFTLHHLWYHLRPSANSLSSLEKLCLFLDPRYEHVYPNLVTPLMIQADSGILEGPSIVEIRGGAMLDRLYDYYLRHSGDPLTASITLDLLRKVAKPFNRMLGEWLFDGIIDDPYHEFMICDNFKRAKNITDGSLDDEYWETRYTLRNDMIPRTLEPVATKVLLTGKYLNVLRECNIALEHPEHWRISLLGGGTGATSPSDQDVLGARK